MSKKVVQDVTRSLTQGGRGDVLCAAQPCWLLLQILERILSQSSSQHFGIESCHEFPAGGTLGQD